MNIAVQNSAIFPSPFSSPQRGEGRERGIPGIEFHLRIYRRDVQSYFGHE